MNIQKATEDDMLKLWEETVESMVPTTRFFYQNIKSGNAEFWTWNHQGTERLWENSIFFSGWKMKTSLMEKRKRIYVLSV